MNINKKALELFLLQQKTKEKSVDLIKGTKVKERHMSYLRTLHKLLSKEELDILKNGIASEEPITTNEGTSTRSLESLYSAIKQGETIVSFGKRKSLVYLLKCENYYKIGTASSLKTRLNTIQTGNPYEVKVVTYSDYLSNAYKVEARLHTAFKHKHVRGEWFALDSEDIDEVKFLLSSFTASVEPQSSKAWHYDMTDPLNIYNEDEDNT